MAYSPRIVIIGAGIVGLSTAYALLEQGMRNVCILEQAVVGHARSTSADTSRLLRFEYGMDDFYSQMVKLSLDLWQEFARDTRKKLYTPTGLLNLGQEGDGSERASEIAHRLGLASERLSAQACRQRFPQFETGDYNVLTYNATGGILHASTCLHTLKRAVLDRGGEIIERSKVTQILHEQRGRPIRLRLSTGEEMAAERVVVTVGPWVHNLLGELELPVKATRQYLFYFAGLSPATFGVGAFPAFMARQLYGFPIHQGSCSWLKAASHQFGRPVDADEAIQFDGSVIAQTVRELRELLPALHGAELAHVKACMYDVSPDEDFILDTSPDDARISFASGLSGHGFKFGLLLGRLLSSIVCETAPAVPLGRFRLARFPYRASRQAVSVA